MRKDGVDCAKIKIERDLDGIDILFVNLKNRKKLK